MAVSLKLTTVAAAHLEVRQLELPAFVISARGTFGVINKNFNFKSFIAVL
jgi:hypothetical protein